MALKKFFAVQRKAGRGSQNAICVRAKVSASTVRDFLKGKTLSMQVETYDKLSRSEGVPMHVLLGEDAPADGAPQPMPPSAVGKLIADRAEALGYELDTLSLGIGRHETYLREYINNSMSTVLPEEEGIKLAGLLGLEPSDLRKQDLGDVDTMERSSSKSDIFQHIMRRGDFDLTLTREVDMATNDLPVFGSVKGSFDGAEIDYQNPVMYVERPARLAGVEKAAGLLVAFESMLPRFRPGETVILDPRLPARAGDDVVVELQDHLAIVKQFVRKTDTYVELLQLNPEQSVKIDRAKVVGIYKITDLRMI
ncbi:MAG TPA: S24 family peptidase [Dongiaceae bacterium]|nr:S24 family peptidase [Dongiaceae bacterium]